MALEILPREAGGMAGRLRAMLTGPKIWAEPREMGDARYVMLHAETDSDAEPDWERIERLGRQWARWIVLPQGRRSYLSRGGLRVFDGNAFYREMLLHTACDLIHRTRMPIYRRVLALLDWEGTAADMLHPLLKYYASVKVVTRNFDCYEAAARRVMEELGAAVQVSDRLSGLGDCVLALAPAPFGSDEDTRLPCPILAAGEGELRLRRPPPLAITGLAPALPAGTTPPEGIPLWLFAAALHTLCGMEDIRPVASALLLGGRMAGTGEGAALLCRQAGIQV